MINKLKTYLLTALMALSLGAPLLATATVAAAPAPGDGCKGISNDIARGATGASGNTITCNDSTVNESALTRIGRLVVSLFSVIVGIIAIIMIIYSGFRYITSGGDSGRIGNAKNTLIYAVVGLIIAALAQLLVRFVLNQSSQITTCASNPAISASDPNCRS